MKCLYRVLHSLDCRTIFRRQDLRRQFSNLVDQDHINNSNDNNRNNNLRELLDDSTLGSGPFDETTVEDSWFTSPYPEGTVIASELPKTLRPNVDPRDTSIILFPGYGSHYVGMGCELIKFPAARDLIDASSSILEYDIFKLMQKGPTSKLNDISYADPAIFVSSLAALEKLKEERPWAIENCVATAGYSVGEIAALTFAGVFSFPDGLKLVRTRAEALKIACEAVKGGMALVHISPNSKLKLALGRAKEWCIDKGINEPVCQIGAYLSPNLKIISGHSEALKYIECNLKYYMLENFHRLPVKGPFQTRLMMPGAYMIRNKLKSITVNEPILCVHSNLSGVYFRDPADIIRTIPKTICHSIKWEQMMNILYEKVPDTNYPETVICGPKSNLGDYLRRANSKAAKAIYQIYI